MAPSDRDDRAIAQSHLELNRRIQRRAHELYLARRGRPGSELEDWLEAEREILGDAKQPAQDRATVVGSAKKPDIVFD